MKLLYIDLFCGAGGTSTGVNTARLNGERCAEVIACVNHDANAIASHASNHPEAVHYTEDIRTLELSPLVAHTERKRKEYPGALVVLWASLECTNFSKAKGGQPRDADSRTLAEHLFRYIEALKPHYIQIENVEEFMSWGDMDENGKPISMDRGKSYTRWVQHVKRYGYKFDYRILNAADYGAYTSRKRYFGIFARKELPVVFPEPTYAKEPQKTLFNELKRWKPVKDVLDLNDEGVSIFMRKKPLSERTLERIYAGLVKFVAGGKNAFLVKYNSMNRNGVYHAPSIDAPCPVVATQNRLGVATVRFLSKQYSGHPESKNSSIEEPAGTVTCIDHHAFVSAYYGNGHNHSVESPAPTLTTKDRLSLVTSQFIDMQYGNGMAKSLETPAGAVTTKPKMNLVSAWLMNPQFSSPGGSVDKPCFTLIARMDKRPPYFVSTKTGELAIGVFDTDSPMTVKIKEFMAMYGIMNIKMRMLKISELKRIMGFPENYVLVGTQADQKKFIGNAVEVNMARVLCEALCRSLSGIGNARNKRARTSGTYSLTLNTQI